jgi:hypothetical protein
MKYVLLKVNFASRICWCHIFAVITAGIFCETDTSNSWANRPRNDNIAEKQRFTCMKGATEVWCRPGLIVPVGYRDRDLEKGTLTAYRKITISAENNNE